MDPITAGFNLATAIVTLAARVWEAAPQAQQSAVAGDLARTLHNCSLFLQDVKAVLAPK
jgi:hypothetical protein